MDLFLRGTLSACVPRFFTDKETGKEVQYFQSGFVTKDGFYTFTSKDLRGSERKTGIWKIQASKAKLAPNAYTLKVIDFVSSEDDDTVV